MAKKFTSNKKILLITTIFSSMSTITLLTLITFLLLVIMPTRSVSMNDEIYHDIHVEMEISGMSWGFVVNRRLKKLMEIESKERKL